MQVHIIPILVVVKQIVTCFDWPLGNRFWNRMVDIWPRRGTSETFKWQQRKCQFRFTIGYCSMFSVCFILKLWLYLMFLLRILHKISLYFTIQMKPVLFLVFANFNFRLKTWNIVHTLWSKYILVFVWLLCNYNY